MFANNKYKNYGEVRRCFVHDLVSSECSTMMEATKRRTIGSVPPSLSRVGPFKRRNARESVIPLLFFCVCCVACCGAEKSHDENSHPTSHTVLLGNSRREGELKNSHAPIRRANISATSYSHINSHKTNNNIKQTNLSLHKMIHLFLHQGQSIIIALTRGAQSK